MRVFLFILLIRGGGAKDLALMFFRGLPGTLPDPFAFSEFSGLSAVGCKQEREIFVTGRDFD